MLILVGYVFSYVIFHAILDLIPLWVLLPLSLLLLSVSIAAYFKSSRLLLVLVCIFSMLGLLLQAFTCWLYLVFSCFDTCIPGRVTVGSLMLLALGSFLLSSVGAFVALRRS